MIIACYQTDSKPIFTITEMITFAVIAMVIIYYQNGNNLLDSVLSEW